jgi:hypothetical protein
LDLGSLLEVNGNPAIAYRETTSGNIYYSRADTSDGLSTWSTPIFIIAPYTYSSIQLGIVGGVPVISCLETGGGSNKIRYIEGDDANGTTFGSPQSAVGLGSNISRPNSQEVNGGIAFVWADHNNDEIYYNKPGAVSSTLINSTANRAVLMVVDGRPAVFYSRSIGGSGVEGLYYLRSDDANGSGWTDTPVLIELGTGSRGIKGLIVDGRPAVFYEASANEIKYLRADDSTGSAWTGTAQIITNGASSNGLLGAAIINNKPALLTQPDGTITYSRSGDKLGDGW